MGKEIKIGNMTVSSGGAFFLIAGPCVIENEEMVLETALFLKDLGRSLDIPVVFKTSYDKANRTSLGSFRGPGIDNGLKIIEKVKDRTGLPVLSDVHEISELDKAAKVLDVIQIPAFLSRQTDLLVSAGKTGIPVNLKKGQFLAPWDMGPAIDKIKSTGNNSIIITERGTSFGYNNLVVDMRSIPLMKKYEVPVVFDATHSVQLPGGKGDSSGGQREYVTHLSRAAIAAGADGVFLEVHPDPDSARCDGPNSLPIDELKSLLIQLKEIHGLINTGRS